MLGQVYSSNKYFARGQQQTNSQQEDGLSEDGFAIQLSQDMSSYHEQKCSKTQIVIGIISLFILIIIAYYLVQLWNASKESDDHLRQAILQHDLNLALQNQWQNAIKKAKKDIKQIKQKTISKLIEQDEQVNRFKGIIQNYETIITPIEMNSGLFQQKLYNDQYLASSSLAYLIKTRKQVDKLLQISSYSKQKQQFVQKNVQQGYKFLIPKNVWVFKEDPYNYMRRLSYQNLKYYAQISGYRLRFINYDSIALYLPSTIEQQVKLKISTISKRLTGQFQHLASKKIILLNFLNTLGGVMLFNQFAFTQNLSWIEDVGSNQFVSRGNRFIKPQVIAFYNPFKSSQKKKYNIKPFHGIQQVDKYVLQIPAMEEFFIASRKNTKFLEQLIKKIYELIDNIDNFMYYSTKYELMIDSIDDFIRRLIFVASSIILKQRQLIIDSQNQDGFKHFAIDYYGMNLINTYYGPRKMQLIYGENVYVPNRDVQVFHHKLYYDLARYKYEQLVAYTGQFKYMCKFPFQYDMNVYLQRSSLGQNIQIYKDSFLYRIFYHGKNQLYLAKNPQKTFTNHQNPLWTDFTEIIWVFLHEKDDTASQFSKVCIHNLKKKAQNSIFLIRYVSNSNIHLYLQQSLIKNINAIIKKSKIDNDRKNRMHFYRLAILYKYGGIFVDSNTITLQNYDWVMNIARIPTQFLFHRYGQLPKVVMMFLPYVGQSEQWTYLPIAKNKNIKIQQHQQFDSNILIAERASEFIGDWLNSLFTVHKMNYIQLERLFIQNKVGNLRSSSYSFPDQIAMFTAKYTLKRKQISLYKHDIRTNVIDYYKIWTINGDLTPSKLKGKFNYEGEDGPINSFFYRFSRKYVEEIVGQIRFFASFVLEKIPQVDEFLEKNKNNNFTTQFHSKSILKEMIQDSSYLERNINKRNRPYKSQIFQ